MLELPLIGPKVMIAPPIQTDDDDRDDDRDASDGCWQKRMRRC